MKWISSLLLGWKSYVLAAIVAAMLSSFATYRIVHGANALVIKDLELQIAKQQALSSTAALNQLTTFIANISKAEASYRAALNDIANRYGAAAKDYANAVKAKPLPVDCKPSIDRVRNINGAIAATNKVTASTP